MTRVKRRLQTFAFSATADSRSFAVLDMRGIRILQNNNV
jgi:hypothetical protein